MKAKYRKPGKGFKSWWRRAGRRIAPIFVVKYVAGQAYRAGWRAAMRQKRPK